MLSYRVTQWVVTRNINQHRTSSVSCTGPEERPQKKPRGRPPNLSRKVDQFPTNPDRNLKAQRKEPENVAIVPVACNQTAASAGTIKTR